MDRRMTCHSREKQPWQDRGKRGGEGALPQSPPKGGMTEADAHSEPLHPASTVAGGGS
jgi:hypothetical protein